MLLLPAILESYRSLKDKTMKIVFETNELTPQQLIEIVNNSQKFGFLAFKEDEFKNEEKLLLEGLKSDYEDKGKSQSTRLRNVLYVNWQQDNLDYGIFNDYYNHHLEKLITHYKNKLD